MKTASTLPSSLEQDCTVIHNENPLVAIPHSLIDCMPLVSEDPLLADDPCNLIFPASLVVSNEEEVYTLQENDAHQPQPLLNLIPPMDLQPYLDPLSRGVGSSGSTLHLETASMSLTKEEQLKPLLQTPCYLDISADQLELEGLPFSLGFPWSVDFQQPLQGSVISPNEKTGDEDLSYATMRAAGSPIVILPKLAMEDINLALHSIEQFQEAIGLPGNNLPTKGHPHTHNQYLKTPGVYQQGRAITGVLNQVSLSEQNIRALGNVEQKVEVSRGVPKPAVLSDLFPTSKSGIKKMKLAENDGPNSTKRVKFDEFNCDVVANLKRNEISQPQIKDLFRLKKMKKQRHENASEAYTLKLFVKKATSIFDLEKFAAEIGEISENPFLSKHRMQDLCDASAKLSSLGTMNQCPSKTLIKLVKILNKITVDGIDIFPLEIEGEEGSEENKKHIKEAYGRILKDVTASLTILHIMIAPKMPESIFLEEAIESIINLVTLLIKNIIRPSYDPVYNAEANRNKSKTTCFPAKPKHILKLYNKLHEALGLLAKLTKKKTLTDGIVLKLSTLGVTLFFIEGISELQLNALHLLTMIFRKYEKHRRLILDDILSSLNNLPTTKRNLHTYRLNSRENIQMLTALVLHMIQAMVKLPKLNPAPCKANDLMDKEALLVKSYEASVSMAITFVTLFFKKCNEKNHEIDYRPVFENFLKDLIVTLPKPEWPAAQLLLSITGKLFSQHICNSSLEIGARLSALEHLGLIASNLHKESFNEAQLDTLIEDALKKINQHITEQGDAKDSKNLSAEEKLRHLQKFLLQFLEFNMASTFSIKMSKTFYISHWYYYEYINAKNLIKDDENDEEINSKIGKKKKEHLKKVKPNKKEEYVNMHKVNGIKSRTDFYLDLMVKKSSQGGQLVCPFDQQDVELAVKILASRQCFSQSTEVYLCQILKMLNESANTMRARALKCLSLIVEVDPKVLLKENIQQAVNGRLLDHSICVREAAVDLIGRFVVNHVDISEKYLGIITNRILDTGLSVRKRVVKIFRDLLSLRPDSPQVADICASLIKRTNDEDSIRKLVEDIFKIVCFNPEAYGTNSLLKKIKIILHIIEVWKKTGVDLLIQLLTNLLKPDAGHSSKSILKACGQIVEGLNEQLIRVENSSPGQKDQALLMTSMYVFCKVRPSLLVAHALTLQSYLSMACASQEDLQVLHHSIKCLELVVPVMEHPSDIFLAQIEEDITKLIIRAGTQILPSCVNCLSIVVSKITHNYLLVEECFQKFVSILVAFQKENEAADKTIYFQKRPALLRSLFTVGLFSCHFDFSQPHFATLSSTSFLNDTLFECMVHFIRHEEEEIQHKALVGLGYMLVRHSALMIDDRIKEHYNYLLSNAPAVSSALKCQVLKNLCIYLLEEEASSVESNINWNDHSKNESLKEMGDAASGMPSVVIQAYLKNILSNVLSPCPETSKIALQLCNIVLNQGLTHPLQLIEHLIAASTSDNIILRDTSRTMIQFIETKSPECLHMKAFSGALMSFKMLQAQTSSLSPRGFFSDNPTSSRLGFLYALIRRSQKYRRAFLFCLIKLFEKSSRNSLPELVYFADSLACLPYQIQEEPLFVLYHADTLLSTKGSSLFQALQKSILANRKHDQPANDDEDIDVKDAEVDVSDILHHMPPHQMSQVRDFAAASQGCLLLLYLSQTLQATYGITDEKLQCYSPNDAVKKHDRQLNRRDNETPGFNPEAVLAFSQTQEDDTQNLLNFYLTFKQLMFKTEKTTYNPNKSKVVPSKDTLNIQKERPNKDMGAASVNAVSNRSTSNKRSKTKQQTAQAAERCKRKKNKSKFKLGDSDSDPDFVI